RYKLCELATHPLLQVVEADLEDSVRIANELPGHQICIHAALIWGDPGSELEARDVAVAAKLFDSCAIAGISRCIYLSSAAVHRPFSGEMSEVAKVTHIPTSHTKQNPAAN
ncbi:MAG TPA: NAD(P)H-binding protein, partial [Dongiaceae bacterium]|nr:NAD(P)H-binding protein [Dongiaceae bacterium]